MPFLLQPGQTLLFTGDSITDCGRRGDQRPLGAGYARMACDLIEAKYPAHELTFVNTGIGGNTVRMLFDRWTDDVIRLQPDWLSIMIGINDLHCWLAPTPEAVSPEEFEQLYTAILDRVRAETRARLVLLTPFYMSTAAPDESEGHRGRVMKHLPTYIAIIEKMAASYDALLVDTQSMFQRLLVRHRADDFGGEPVHPNPTGHLHIAHEWLEAVDW